MIVHLLYLLLALPLVAACISLALRGRAADWVAGALSLGTAVLALYLVFSPYVSEEPIGLATLPWMEHAKTPPRDFLFGFLFDYLSALMVFVIAVVGFLVVLYSADYVGPKNKEHPVTDGKGRYYFWMALFIASMLGVATSPNFLQLYIFWEMTTLCSWALISYYETDRALRAGFKALIMTVTGGLALMVAMVILFIKTGSFSFSAMNMLPPGLRNMLFVLILVAAWAKASQVPFYTWLPDAMEAPTPVSAYLHAAAMVKAGVYLVARTVSATYGLSLGVGLLTAIMAFITMFIAVFLFFFQDDLKRILALSTITHLAYILLGCGLGILGSDMAFRGGLLHIAAHASGKGLLFLSVGALSYFTGHKELSKLSGAGAKYPLISLGFLVGALTVTGIPPLAGFWSKFYLLTGALGAGAAGAVFAVLILLESLVAFGFFLWVWQRVFLGRPSKAVLESRSASTPMSIALLVLMVLCFIVPLVVLPWINATSIAAVMGGGG